VIFETEKIHRLEFAIRLLKSTSDKVLKPAALYLS
jgi:hypothetical protein